MSQGLPFSVDHGRDSRRMQNTLGIADAGATELDANPHIVQFYARDSELIHSLRDFVAPALTADEVAVVIATEAHRLALDEELQKLGVDLEAARASRRYIALDAAETLAEFMDGSTPEPQRFAETLGRLFSETSIGGQRVRAFGEMVALLWTEGNLDGALRLEDLWNHLAASYPFTLFCAYPELESRQSAFDMIRDRHSKVVPSGS